MAVTRDVSRASLYSGLINLWVEDELTHAYLSAVWNSPDVKLLVGGGNEGVRAIVKDAEESGFKNVFALIDRDFRQTNRYDWLDPGKTFRTFVLRVHDGSLALRNEHTSSQVAFSVSFTLRKLKDRLTRSAERGFVPREHRLVRSQ